MNDRNAPSDSHHVRQVRKYTLDVYGLAPAALFCARETGGHGQIRDDEKAKCEEGGCSDAPGKAC